MRYFLFFLTLISTLAAQTYTPKNYSHLIGMPGFSDTLLQMHFKLYEGYVKNTNDLLAELKSMAGKSSYEYGALKRRLGWEFDGMWLHELYFENLGGNGQIDAKSSLAQALASQYGSADLWKKDFITTGLMRGIGWVILYRDSQTGTLINAWVNEHDTGHIATANPLLVMDVWEHAYMPQYSLDRAKYIDAFFANLSWDTAQKRFEGPSSKPK